MAHAASQVDGAHRAVNLAVRQVVISKVRGHLVRWSAKLEFDPAEVTRSTDFLDAAKYPRLRYRTRKVEVASMDRLRVASDATREIALEIEYVGEGRAPGATPVALFATASPNRKDFHLPSNQALEKGGVRVADRVDSRSSFRPSCRQPPGQAREGRCP